MSVLHAILRPLTSLKLTIVCLSLAMALVFFGTIEQVHLGIYGAQQKYFESLFVMWGPPGSNRQIPVLPGGYLLGAVLLVNLIAAQAVRFKFTIRKSGIYLLHLGIILLLIGQLLTSLFAREAQMRLDEGQTKNYSESFLEKELAVIDTSDSKSDRVVSIPEALLLDRKPITTPSLPFAIQPVLYFKNSLGVTRDRVTSLEIPTLPIGPQAVLVPIAPATNPDETNTPSASLRILTPDGKTQDIIVSERLDGPQTVSAGGKTWMVQLRPRRFYKPFAITLQDFTHKIYAGTSIPKDFSSKVTLTSADGEKRDALIYMNHPLRFGGNTFYQLAFDNNDTTSILQVVRNPSWLLPYIACTLVALGLTVQFCISLSAFARRRKTSS
ncbi:MAG TPA: cytochrome c biogenesis protein ResB [Chthoniobacterales bacterium]